MKAMVDKNRPAWLVPAGLILLSAIPLAIRRRDFAQHGDWMLRGYAIGMGAGTQVLTLMAGPLIGGLPSELSRALLMGAAWMINLAVAEWIIRKRPARAQWAPATGSARPASAVISRLQ